MSVSILVFGWAGAMMGGFAFLAPWALVGFLALPLLWYLLKIIPPQSKRTTFPAIRILHDFKDRDSTSTKSPWWLLVLRLSLFACLILALARPVLHEDALLTPADSPLVLIIDNDWSVASALTEIKQHANRLISAAEEQNRPVLLIATAEPLNQQTPIEMSSAGAARAQLDTLQVRPWPEDRSAHLEHLRRAPRDILREASVFWFSNGLTNEEEEKIAARLQDFGSVRVLTHSQTGMATIIRNLSRHPDGFELSLQHIGSTEVPKKAFLLDENANTIFESPLEPLGRNDLYLIRTPQEIRAMTQSVRLETPPSIATHALLDQRWRDQRVGLLSLEVTAPTLMEEGYFAYKSLLPHARVETGPLPDLLARPLALLIDPKGDHISSPEHQKQVLNWVRDGGLYVRFAAPDTAAVDPAFENLFPVRPLELPRTFGGSLSWDSTPPMAPFSRDSPFFDLAIVEDLNLKKQVLAQPGSLGGSEIWASLGDQTPLVSARKVAHGWLVFFHVTATPDWSDLPYSGTFEQMMQRLLLFAENRLSTQETDMLAPLQVMDGYGALGPPSANVSALSTHTLEETRLSASHPPGYYGLKASAVAFNAGPALGPYQAIDDYGLNVEVGPLAESRETRFAPWLFFIALLLFLLDWMTSLHLKGHLLRATATFVLITLPLSANASDTALDLSAIEAASSMRLAYLKTGDEVTDRVSRQGLNSLTEILRRRTSVEMAPSMAFDPQSDDPVLFPLIYWPVTAERLDLDPKSRQRLKQFMATGGFILFDTMGHDQPEALSHLHDQLALPKLEQVPETHVLSRSFYLLQDFPGRFQRERPWIAVDTLAEHDRVSPVLVGSNAWAQAWARDDQHRPVYGVVPGAERQREAAYRFGVNLVMYVLSGNYKGDQVHMPAIIQRLGL